MSFDKSVQVLARADINKFVECSCEQCTDIGVRNGSPLNKGNKLTCRTPQGSLDEVEFVNETWTREGLGKEAELEGVVPSRCISFESYVVRP